jgi:uncharacterized protein YbaA (DUF1428 family)
MPQYVDGFVLPVPRKKLAAYLRLARFTGRIWRELGALDYRECLGDDLKPSMGPGFVKGIRARKGEVIFFSYIVYRSKAHRDQVNAKVMKDPRLLALCEKEGMPFDLKRMLHGGFRVAVRA